MSIGERARGAGISAQMLEDLSRHARERTGGIVKDMMLNAGEIPIMSAVALSSVAGIADALAGLIGALSERVVGRPLDHHDAARIAAALIIAQMTVYRDGSEPQAQAAFFAWMAANGFGALAAKLNVEVF